MPKLEIKNRWTDAVIYAGEAATIAELLVNAVRDHINLSDADLRHADLSGAVLSGAVLSGAVLSGADLKGASIEKNTIIETGETWGRYLNEVLPALLTAGGRTLTEVLTPQHWDCHSWQNCPMAAAFATHNIDGVPLLLKPRAEQFIRYFDAKLIPIKAIPVEAR